MTNNKYQMKKLALAYVLSIDAYISLIEVQPMSYLICDYLRSIRYLLVVLREYTLKVQVLVSSEHTLSRVK